jgi:hypothetical protein
MPSRARAGLFAAAVVLVLAGCKERQDASRPLPAPEPPATAALTPPRDNAAPAPKKRPTSAEDDVAPAKPKQPSAEVTPKAPSGSDPAATSDPAPTTGGSAAGGSAATAPAASVPPIAAPSAACLARCQSSMQACLSQPVDGGVPGFANLDLCKNAFAACQSACK